MKPVHVFSPLKWILSFIVLFYSCTEQKVVPNLDQSLTPNSKPIQEFSVMIDGAIYKGTIEKDSLIQLKVPYSDVRSIQPTIKLAQGFSISPNSSQIFDLTKQIKYKIMDSKGASKSYLITTSIAPSSLAISKLVVNDQIGDSFIDTVQRKITVKVKQTVDLSRITISSLTSSPKTTVLPGITQAINFYSPVKFTVKGVYGESKDWMVNVVQDIPLSSSKDIIQFELEQQATTNLPLEVFINTAAHRVEINYSNGANITELKISKFAMSPNATLQGSIPSVIDLGTSSPIFSVRAQDGSIQVWTMIAINKGLSNKTNTVTLSCDDYLKKGYSFFDHTVLYDFATNFSTDKSYIKVLDMQAASIFYSTGTSGGPGSPAAAGIVNVRSFQSGIKQDENYVNGTEFVQIPSSMNFTDYSQMKNQFDISTTKTNRAIDHDVKVGDKFIAKVRGSEYYVLIQITQVLFSASDHNSFTFSFTYKY